MEGTVRWAGVVAEAAALLEELVLQEAALLDAGDLLTVERRLQQVFRQVGSSIVSGVLQQRAQGPEGEAAGCPACGRRLHLVGRERRRAVLGLVGEYRFARPTFHCATCHAGHAPLDAVLGLGDARLSPGLAQVVCAQAQQVSFAAASTSVQGSLGVYVAAETIRRLADGVGRLIEQDQTDRAQWRVLDDALPERLLVETDGVQTPLLDGYHEAKVGRVGVLGPTMQTDPETGRQVLVLHDSTFCVGLERADDFFDRFVREAWRAGATRGVRQIVCLGDGSRWIWLRFRSQFALPGVEVVEIVDFRHASEHLADVAKAVFGEGTLQATTWWAAQRHALLHQGATPVLAALADLLARPDLDQNAHDTVRRDLEEYFTDNKARMDYPGFIARHLPIGSGAVESACKLLISQRHKGAGMRWTAQGAQEIASLRALYHSAHARWATFWASRPLARLRLLPPLATPALVAADPAALSAPAPPDPSTTTGDTSASPHAAPTASRIATAGKPWAKGRDYWRRQPACPTRSA